MSMQTRMDRVARRLGLFGVATAGLLALAACGGAGSTPTLAPTSTPSLTVEPATPNNGESVADVPDVAFTLIPRAEQGIFIGIAGVDHMPNPTLRVPRGSVVQVTLQNEDGAEYDIYFPDFEAKSERVVGSGSTTSLVFVADRKGEFVYYSTVPGHREAGMEGRIVVGE